LFSSHGVERARARRIPPPPFFAAK